MNLTVFENSQSESFFEKVESFFEKVETISGLISFDFLRTSKWGCYSEKSHYIPTFFV